MALVLRVATAIGLAVVAAVHLALANRYDLVGEQVSLGQLFRVQDLVAGLAALALLARPTRPVVVVGAAVALLSLLAVAGTTYLALPAMGPLPRVYEPIWFGEKALAAGAAELAAAAAAALAGHQESAR